MIKLLQNTLGLTFVLLFSCREIEYHKDLLQLEITSNRADCEENNLNFKITEVDHIEYKELIGQYVLPLCMNEVCEKSIYSVGNSDTLNIYLVKGYISIGEHNMVEYGCLGSKTLKIEKVLSERKR